jgi:uncharacterized protein YegL
MNIKIRLKQLAAGIRTFLSEKRGNVAVTFALLSLPIIGFVGAAVDYSIANSARTALLGAMDATALMLSKEAPTLNQDQLVEKANKYFNAIYNRTEAGTIEITPTFSQPVQGSYQLSLAGKGTVPTHFASVIGKSTIDIHAFTQVNWGVKKLEVALALDNTGSMSSSGKMTNLKTAAKNLITVLKNAAKKKGDVKISIIPFEVVVKLDTSYKNEFWMNFDDISKSSWKGCVQDREKSPTAYNTMDTTPVSGNDKTHFPAVKCPNNSLASLMPLTDVFEATGYDSLNDKIDAMTPVGNTNTTIGLEWAWHSLTENLPLPEGATPAPDLDKVIIMLTDGDNTEDRWDSKASKIDPRMESACANVKAANIKIYTIRVINGNASLLKNCATNPSMYYDVQQASQLNNVFSSIAQNLANLRVAKSRPRNNGSPAVKQKPGLTAGLRIEAAPKSSGAGHHLAAAIVPK